MSAVSILPIVRGVRSILAGRRLFQTQGALIGQLHEASRATAARLVERVAAASEKPLRLEPVRAVREAFQKRREEARRALEGQSLPRLEVARLATVVALERTAFAAEWPLVHAADAVMQADCEEELADAERGLLQAVEREHAACFTDALSTACREAGTSLGFEPREVRMKSGQIRIVATDSHGRSLVTEIEAGPDQEPRVQTEVVGVTDGSCQALLDAFDAALERQGVEGGRRERRMTGGVCTLAAAREFFGKTLRKVAPRAPVVSAATSSERTARLNLTSRLTNRRGG